MARCKDLLTAVGISSRRQAVVGVAAMVLVGMVAGLARWQWLRTSTPAARVVATAGVNSTAGRVVASVPTRAAVPWHRRPGYEVRSPDVLRVEINIPHLTDPRKVEGASGNHLIDPDGRINLGPHLGKCWVDGMTTAEIEADLARRLATEFGGGTATVAVQSQNSRAYYVIGNTGGVNKVSRMPCIDGQETVRQAISQFNGLGDPATNFIFVSRPVAGGGQPDTVLPVDWNEIMTGPGATNHTLLPGDRIFVQPHPSVWGFVVSFVKNLTGF